MILFFLRKFRNLTGNIYIYRGKMWKYSFCSWIKCSMLWRNNNYIKLYEKWIIVIRKKVAVRQFIIILCSIILIFQQCVYSFVFHSIQILSFFFFQRYRKHFHNLFLLQDKYKQHKLCAYLQTKSEEYVT